MNRAQVAVAAQRVGDVAKAAALSPFADELAAALEAGEGPDPSTPDGAYLLALAAATAAYRRAVVDGWRQWCEARDLWPPEVADSGAGYGTVPPLGSSQPELFDELVDDPAAAVGSTGHGHPDTSRLAERAKRWRFGSQRARIGEAFYQHADGLTDEEAARLAGVASRSMPWARCSELRTWRFLEPIEGLTRETSSGEQAQVWRMTDAGRRLWFDRFHDEQRAA